MKKIINEQLNISNSNPIKARAYDYKFFSYPWHFHSEYEIIYVDKGYGKCVIGDNILDFSAHTLFLFGPELPHWMRNPDCFHEENELRVNGIIVQFEKDFMQYSFSHYVQFMQIQDMLECANRGLRFDLSFNSEIVTLVKRIPEAEGLEQILLILKLLQSLSQLTDKEQAASPSYNLTLAGYKDKKIEKVIAYLSSRYTSNISLEEIASFTAMNPAAFCRFFKEKTGKTFKEYITEMRIGYACKLLYLDRSNISQISMECGFESVSNFNRCFKRIIGCSPTVVKEKLYQEKE